ncbi:MAG: NAD(P)(+) transhydrogenase (Re/Si-specific) subunit beta [Pirellulaceae bacterium]|nr:NAD(P)(+) transhydrogenase (Re/Si-specific) subunit beta [Pirellulaceae bacterium]
METKAVIQIAYVIAAALFVLGLKLMSHPRNAVRGNQLGAAGMLLAIIVTLWHIDGAGWWVILVGLAVGSLVGAILAIRIQMTAMPQLVALFNGFGGGASVLVAFAELLRMDPIETPPDVLTATGLTALIGAVTFWGSLVAFGKLQELSIFKRAWSVPGQQIVNAILALIAIGLMIGLVNAGSNTSSVSLYLAIVLITSVLGVLLVLPIGGADMPVVIALLNSYSGLAAAATGFVINNNVLIIAGSLVGASGLILTKIMCKAMNRSLVNVLFGVMEAGSSVVDDEVYARVRSTSADDVAMILETANRVVFVPGYGMAVAQAQHAVRELADNLSANQTTVEYAIHPVAGRMPGHMNVLLAEADVPYDQLIEMDRINPTMQQVDVAIVLGANDVVNPVARTDPDSPIAGMPIIDVDKARTVIVIKRSLSPGFAGIPNPLFAADNTLMLFGDGKQAMLDVVAAIKENQ